MARRGIDATEQERVAVLIKRYPLPLVRNMTGWSYKTLARIAEVMAA